MLVYVLNAHGKPFMPCKPAKAKKLLRNGKAKVISRMPFVIQLLFGSSGYKQKVVQKLDSGSKTVGTAAVRADGKVLYASEIKTRTDIPEKMAQRLSYRRTRRGRKNEIYRAPRFDNRARTDNWLTPTIRSKIQTYKRNKIYQSILPICDNAGGLIIETATFDIHKSQIQMLQMT